VRERGSREGRGLVHTDAAAVAVVSAASYYQYVLVHSIQPGRAQRERLYVQVGGGDDDEEGRKNEEASCEAD
jgi:hypothetical protein